MQKEVLLLQAGEEEEDESGDEDENENVEAEGSRVNSMTAKDGRSTLWTYENKQDR